MILSPTNSKNAVLAVVCLAIFTDMFTFGVIVPILPTIVNRVSHNSTPTMQSVLYAFYAVGLFVTTPIIGWLSDNYLNRQAPMLGGLFGLAFCTLLFSYSPNFELLLLARFLQGVSAAASWVIGFAILADTFSHNDGLGIAVGIAMGFSSAGYIAGPSSSGILYKYYGIHAPFYVCFFLAALDFIGRIFIRSPAPLPKKDRSSIVTILKDLRILTLLSAVVFSSAIFSSMEASIASHLTKSFKMDEYQVSLVLFVMLAPSIIGSIVVGKACDMGASHHLIIFIGLIINSISGWLLASATSIQLLIPSAIFFGGTHSFISTPSMPKLALIVEDMGVSSYASVYALSNMAYSIGMVMGPILVGIIQSYKSFATGIAFLAIPTIIYAPIFFLNSISLEKKHSISLKSSGHQSPKENV